MIDFAEGIAAAAHRCGRYADRQPQPPELSLPF